MDSGGRPSRPARGCGDGRGRRLYGAALERRGRDFGAVVNWVGAGLLVEGVDSARDESDTSAWTVDGEPTPSVGTSNVDDEFVSTGDLETDWDRLLEATDDATLEAASVDLAAIEAPILLVSAGEDAVWPSQLLLNRTESRLDELNYDYAYDHLTHDEAGHGVGVPSLPTAANRPGQFGGTPAATAALNAESWSVVLEYFGHLTDR